MIKKCVHVVDIFFFPCSFDDASFTKPFLSTFPNHHLSTRYLDPVLNGRIPGLIPQGGVVWTVQISIMTIVIPPSASSSEIIGTIVLPSGRHGRKLHTDQLVPIIGGINQSISLNRKEEVDSVDSRHTWL